MRKWHFFFIFSNFYSLSSSFFPIFAKTILSHSNELLTNLRLLFLFYEKTHKVRPKPALNAHTKNKIFLFKKKKKFKLTGFNATVFSLYTKTIWFFVWSRTFSYVPGIIFSCFFLLVVVDVVFWYLLHFKFMTLCLSTNK